MKLRSIIFAAALALASVACGADDAPTVAEPAATEPAGSEGAAPAAGDVGDMPDLDMINLHTGEALNLQTLVTGQNGLLLWFWAPH